MQDDRLASTACTVAAPLSYAVHSLLLAATSARVHLQVALGQSDELGGKVVRCAAYVHEAATRALRCNTPSCGLTASRGGYYEYGRVW